MLCIYTSFETGVDEHSFCGPSCGLRMYTVSLIYVVPLGYFMIDDG